MTILVIGDSISFGLELSDLPTRHAGLFGKEYWDSNAEALVPMTTSRLAWPQLVATAMNQDLENLSQVGASNQRIHRLAVSQSLKKSYTLIICAWTTITRFEVAYQGQSCPVTAGNPKWDWVKNYYADHYDENLEIERFYANLLTLQSFFKQHNQSYLFVRAISDNLKFQKPIIGQLSNLIDRTHCEFWNESMNEFCRKAHVPFGPGSHFLEQGHQLVAERIINFLKK